MFKYVIVILLGCILITLLGGRELVMLVGGGLVALVAALAVVGTILFQLMFGPPEVRKAALAILLLIIALFGLNFGDHLIAQKHARIAAESHQKK